MTEALEEVGAEVDANWWRTAVVYQIYPRTFADADGNGEGDLQGVISRIPYLESLGVDAVWLSPFYTSKLKDGGYDVDNHREVDPRHGTIEDFEEMVSKLHEAGIRVIVDIVPNHTSDQHEWFKAALAAEPGSPERERYIFRDGIGPGGELPPNDWEAVFGGSCWAPAGDGQFYMHMFATEQPDLNWENEEVQDDLETTLRFWADKGVDGFRIDVAHGLRKNLSEPYAPWVDIKDHKVEVFMNGEHPLWDRDDVQEIYAAWRKIFDSYDPPRMAVAEADVHPMRRPRYASVEGLGQAFNFVMQSVGWDAYAYRNMISSTFLDEALRSDSTTTWLLGCHDEARVATRYGLPQVPHKKPIEMAWQYLLSRGTFPELDWKAGIRRARAAVMIGLALPGSYYIFQGDELGLHEVIVPPEEWTDPRAFNSTNKPTRDGCRVPIPWTLDMPSFGFGSAPGYLGQPEWFADFAVSVQQHDPESTLSMYRGAIALRKEMLAEAGEDFNWMKADPEVVHFRRGERWHSVTNFGEEPVLLPEGEVVLSSARLFKQRLLPVDATAWVVEA